MTLNRSKGRRLVVRQEPQHARHHLFENLLKNSQKQRLEVSGMRVGVRASPQPTFTYGLYFRAFVARFLTHLIYLLAQLALALVQLD